MPFLMYAERKAKAEGKLEGELEGKLKGKLEGRQEALLSVVIQLLVERFGALNSALQTKLQKLSAEQLQSLFAAALKFESVTELTVWLKQYTNVSPELVRAKRRKVISQ